MSYAYFTLYPNGRIPAEIYAQIPIELCNAEKTILGVAVGARTMLNLQQRLKIENYLGRASKVVIIDDTKHNDILIFIKESLIKGLKLNQTEMSMQ